ncbi:hypothetical protein BRADI_3g12887v3 [Brachypodium distachyon]|uniref:Uncharacterized protein n=1 Tax=Brachypodium distachyon TaxID=15368 RepID=A0A0Q3J964_BRADI|nr:hypothetical protein BRADI_3g12887v3 [Brachypodium distachyon]
MSYKVAEFLDQGQGKLLEPRYEPSRLRIFPPRCVSSPSPVGAPPLPIRSLSLALSLSSCLRSSPAQTTAACTVLALDGSTDCPAHKQPPSLRLHGLGDELGVRATERVLRGRVCERSRQRERERDIPAASGLGGGGSGDAMARGAAALGTGTGVIFHGGGSDCRRPGLRPWRRRRGLHGGGRGELGEERERESGRIVLREMESG